MSSGSVTARVETWPGKSSSWFLHARSLGAIAVLLVVWLLSSRPFSTTDHARAAAAVLDDHDAANLGRAPPPTEVRRSFVRRAERSHIDHVPELHLAGQDVQRPTRC